MLKTFPMNSITQNSNDTNVKNMIGQGGKSVESTHFN